MLILGIVLCGVLIAIEAVFVPEVALVHAILWGALVWAAVWIIWRIDEDEDWEPPEEEEVDVEIWRKGSSTEKTVVPMRKVA